MSHLTEAERDKFADYLERSARDDEQLAAQCETIGEKAMAKKLRIESMAARVVLKKLRATHFQSVEIGNG